VRHVVVAVDDRSLGAVVVERALRDGDRRGPTPDRPR